MPLRTRRMFRRVQPTCVTIGEISTAYGRQRRRGRCKDAPHGVVAAIGLERLRALLMPVLLCFVLAYIIT